MGSNERAWGADNDFPHENILTMHRHPETPISMFCPRGVILVKTISYIFSSLVACHDSYEESSAALLHYALYLKHCHVTWWLIWEESIFWKNLQLAHLFLCSSAPIQNYFAQFSFDSSVKCSDTIGTQYSSLIGHQLSLSHSRSARLHVNRITQLPIMTIPLTSGYALYECHLFSHWLWSNICTLTLNATSCSDLARTSTHACPSRSM